MRKSIVQISIRMIFPVVLIIFFWSSSIFASEQYELVAEWGGLGEEDGQFISPLGLTLDSEDNIYVTDISLAVYKNLPQKESLSLSGGERVKEMESLIVPGG